MRERPGAQLNFAKSSKHRQEISWAICSCVCTCEMHAKHRSLRRSRSGLFDSVRSKRAMVASFEHPMATRGSKRTDTHLASHQSTGRTSPDQIGRSPSPSYMSDQMLWYRSDGYYSPRPTTPMGLMDDTVSRPWGAATASRPQTAIGGFGGRDWGGHGPFRDGRKRRVPRRRRRCDGRLRPGAHRDGPRDLHARAHLDVRDPRTEAARHAGNVRALRARALWQGPKSGWAHLLPKRPGAFAESLCGKTSRDHRPRA